MKYKVGNKVKIINNDDNYFKIGEIAIIDEIDGSSVPYKCSRITDGKKQWLSKKDIELVKYTWEDFLKAPVGTKVTFEGGKYLFKTDKDKYGDEFANLNKNFSYEYLENFELDDVDYGKIIKIEEPTYTIVREQEKIEEMTMEEICKALGKNIKIVKEK